MAIGPWTNLALLEVMRPGILADADLVLMGGIIRTFPEGFPQWGPVWDYNIQQDVRAAEIVLSRSHPLIVPMEITIRTAITKRDAARLETGDPLAMLVAKQSTEYGRDSTIARAARQQPRIADDFLTFQHDALACMTACQVAGNTIEEIPLRWLLNREGLLEFRIVQDGTPTRVVADVAAAVVAERWLDPILAAAN